MTALQEQVATLVGEVDALRGESGKLHEVNTTLAKRDKEQAALIQALQAQVAQLRAEMSKCRCGRGKPRGASPPYTEAKAPAEPASPPTPEPSDKPAREPKKPGRKPGQGLFKTREAPQTISEEILVDPPSGACPSCGGTLEQVNVETATTTDLPPLPPPAVTAFKVPVCKCTACGKSVRGTHPRLPASQFGATSHRLSEPLLMAAHFLHYQVGIPVRRLPQVLKLLCNIDVTQSALTQAALRQSEGKAKQGYAELVKLVRTRAFVHTDDTSWKIHGEQAYLMVFQTLQECIFQIRPQHRNDEVREVIPSDYKGTFISDRGPSYDSRQLAGVKQQKCLDHLDRNLKELIHLLDGAELQIALQIRKLLWDARKLWEQAGKGETVPLEAERERIREELSAIFNDESPHHPKLQSLLDDLSWRHQEDQLLRFLSEPGVEPSNNPAERALRGPVIQRKISHGAKTNEGAFALSLFASLFRTIGMRGLLDPIAAACEFLRTGKLPEGPDTTAAPAG